MIPNRFKIAVIILAAIGIREVFAPFTGHPFDFELWVRLGYYVSKGDDPYLRTAPVPGLSFPGSGYISWPGYPPLWAIFMAVLYKFYVILGVQNRFLYYFILKQPMIISDLLVGYLIYILVRAYSSADNSIKALTFWLLCPFTIIISAIWGMFDQIMLMLILLSAILIGRTYRSALTESLSIAIKLIPVIFLPVFALAQTSRKKIFAYMLLAAIVSVALAFAPYLVEKSWKISTLLGVGIDDTNKLGNSMSYWSILYVYNQSYAFSPFVKSVLGFLSFLWIPAILTASYFCYSRVLKDKINLQKNLILSLLFISLVFYLTKSTVNEQYLIYFLGFGTMDYFLWAPKERRRTFHAVWISALGFLVANNAWMTRFFSPLSFSYMQLNNYFTSGVPGEVRFGVMIFTSLVFTIAVCYYLKMLYAEMKASKKREPKLMEMPIIPT